MKYTVIGAGHGGQALAGFLALQGADVLLYNRTECVIENIKEYGGIEIQGYFQEKVSNVEMTSDLREAIHKAAVIMVCIPSHYHTELAIQIKDLLAPKQIVILNPGRTLGAYHFDNVVDATNRGIIIAETDTFLLTSRKIQDGISKIFSLKERVYLGCTNQNAKVIVDLLKKDLPMLYPAETLVYTSLSNIGAIFHPIPALFNITRIERGEDFLHYKEGISPTLCTMLEKLDMERIQLARKLGVDILSAKEWIKSVYNSEGDSLYEVIQNTKAYDEVMAPKEISTRYIFEDISTGIVPMYCLAEDLNSPNHMMKLTIQIATEMFEYDFMKEGRNDVEDFIKKY